MKLSYDAYVRLRGMTGFVKYCDSDGYIYIVNCLRTDTLKADLTIYGYQTLSLLIRCSCRT